MIIYYIVSKHYAIDNFGKKVVCCQIYLRKNFSRYKIIKTFEKVTDFEKVYLKVKTDFLTYGPLQKPV